MYVALSSQFFSRIISPPEKLPNSPRLGQKTALVTGVIEGGIGGTLVTELHRAGYFVFCTARRASAMSPFLREGMSAIVMDVTSTESILIAVEEVFNQSGGILDLLINNAGTATHLPALDLDADVAVAHVFNVNVLGPMRTTKAFSPLLIKAQGRKVNIGSIAPVIPLPLLLTYNASKAALHSYGDCLRMELAPLGKSALLNTLHPKMR